MLCSCRAGRLLPPWRATGHTPRERNPVERLLKIDEDGDPVTDQDNVHDLFTNWLGWNAGTVRPATPEDMPEAWHGDPAAEGHWMVELSAALEQNIAEAEREKLHYWAMIWTVTGGTVICRVEAVMTW